MKRFHRYILNFILISLVFSTISLVMNSNLITGNYDLNNSDPLHFDVKRINLSEKKFFNITEFTNTSHSINLTREIISNRYGYTTSLTYIRLYNNASESFNVFNYTIPIQEFENTKYLEISSSNGTKSETQWEIIEENNESVTLEVIFPAIESETYSEIKIQMDHPNIITFDEAAKLDASTFPYHFNLSFYPLITLPVTSYELIWTAGRDTSGAPIQVSIDNKTILPTSEDVSGDITTNTAGITFTNISKFPKIKQNLLNKSEYGSYNLTNLQDLNFIPAYNHNLASNLTYYLSFDYYHFSSTMIELKSLKTSITVSEWGFVTTEHEIIVHNIGLKSGPVLSTAIGGPTFPSIEFFVPFSSFKIGTRDIYGNITPIVSPDSITNRKIVEVNPRIEIEQGYEYKLYLSYREKSTQVVRNLGNGKLMLELPLSLGFNCTVRKFELDVYFPFGSKFTRKVIVDSIVSKTLPISAKESENIVNSSLVYKKEFLGIFNKIGTQIIFDDLTPLGNKPISIEFGISPFYALYQPISFAIFLFIIGFIYILIRNYTFGFKPKAIALDEIPLDLIKNFVKSYEEKTAIREQLIRLDQKRKSKNISAREYEQTRIILKNRQQQTDRSIVSVSKKLAGQGQRYRLSMRSIEVAEANRDDVLRNIDSLERKKTQATIGKEAYLKLKLNYDKKLRSLNNDIDKVLIELRSLLTK